MAQSDYIQYKKNSIQIKDLSNYPSVLESNTYTDFSMYALENQGTNSKNRFSQLIPVGKRDVLGMEKNISGTCPSTFVMCKNTNTRTNRKANTTSIPAPTFRFNKNPAVITCVFTSKNGFVTRTCPCSKTVCKCGTTICENGK